jgi:ribosomal protein L40E
MKCAGCGAALPDGAKHCMACGREVNLPQKAAEESVRVAKEAGMVAGKIGKELWSGMKAVGSSTKKGLKGSEEKKEQS